jgi:biopolymer transport protein ExbD
MKKFKLITVLVMLSMFVSLTTASASEIKKSEKNTVTSSSENTLSTEDIKILNLRVEEIRDMDKSDLSVLEKRELRNELKAIKKDLRQSNGAIYIGTGTLLLIIILIILLV